MYERGDGVPKDVIKARTDATAIHGLGEAIRRLNLYAEAGADVLYADALLSAEDIALVAKEVIRPLAVNMGFGIRARRTTPLMSARQLQDLGVDGFKFDGGDLRDHRVDDLVDRPEQVVLRVGLAQERVGGKRAAGG